MNYLMLILALVSFEVADARASQPLITVLTERYRKAKMVDMIVEKIVESQLIGKTTHHQGRIYLMGELFRFDIDLPEKSQIIFDGKDLWSIQYPSAEFGGELVVSKQPMTGKAQSQIFLSTLLMKENIKRHFNLIKETKDANIKEARITVKPKNENLGIGELDIKMDMMKNKNLVREVKYSDEVGNKTTLFFPKVIFKDKSEPGLFRYTPPKGTKVIQL